jgi:quinolinate synthase
MNNPEPSGQSPGSGTSRQSVPGPAAAQLISDIISLKRENQAVVLTHNYQPPVLFEIADFIGDSLELARRAAEVSAPLIVFCGVKFMAETAKILSPEARVILPEPKAGCQMADMITGAALRMKREELAPVTVVAYVNTPADVKAESDICCTSANAVKVAGSLPADERILFVPDKHLARYVARETGRDIVPWEGHCYVHAFFTAADVARARRQHPDAVIVSHPECPLEVLDASDHVASTGGMVRLAAVHQRMVLGTEHSMCSRVLRDYPDNRCWPLRRTAVCKNMKMTSLAKVKAALRGRVPEVTLPLEVAERARAAIERMMVLS